MKITNHDVDAVLTKFQDAAGNYQYDAGARDLTKEVNKAVSESTAAAALMAGLILRQWPIYHLVMAAFIAGMTSGIRLVRMLASNENKEKPN